MSEPAPKAPAGEAMRGVLFGAAYYAEYHAAPRLVEDLELMAEARFSLIRVGESVWSSFEPEDGVFTLEWLGPILDGAAEHGLKVILGTPTYAVPPWLARRHPEIAAELRSGEPVPFGGRQEVDFSHPAFRWHAERVIRAVLSAYGRHPAVIGVQVDNEPGLHLPRNHSVFQRFVDRLRARYRDVDALNEAWGLTYWSHRLASFADLWRPDGNTFPQYDLAWRRYQADLTTEFIAWQAAIAREYVAEDAFVTTCIAYDRPGVSDRQLAGVLDVVAANLYYEAGDGLERSASGGPRVPRGWAAVGVESLTFAADRAFSSAQAPFLVTETDATSIGGPHMNWPPYPGQLRQVAFALIARGARAIEYWHWHSLPYGAETYWGGVLPHSLRPGRIYQEVASLGAELAAAAEVLDGLVPEASVGVVWSQDSKWAMEYAPPLADEHGAPDVHSYVRIVRSLYDGAFSCGRSLRLIHDAQLGELEPAEVARELPVLVVAGLVVSEDATLSWLARYAEAGGHLIVGVRSGYADEEARARLSVAPGALASLCGAHYEEFANLSVPLAVRSTGAGALSLMPGAAGTAWVDGLIADHAEVLATYDHPYFGRFAAVTSTAVGRGRATMVGTVANPALATALLSWACRDLPAPFGELPSSVSVSSARNRAGARRWFVHNWSFEPATVAAPFALTDALSGLAIDAGEALALGPWDARILLER